MPSRREKHKAKQRKEQGRQLAAKTTLLSSIFKHLKKDGSYTGQKALLANRVSTSKQERDLVGQILYVRKEAELAGVEIVGCSIEIANGADIQATDRILEEAKRTGAGIVLYETTCRAIRHPDFGRGNLDDPTEEQLEQLNEKYKEANVTPVVCLHPDSSFREIRAHQIKCGLAVSKGKGKGSREYKESRRQAFLPYVYQLSELGASVREIARLLDLPRDTVRYWLK